MLIKMFFIAALCANVYGYKLKQVIVIGRHNIRTPLVSSLDDYTPKRWPVWNVSSGYLTEKGGRIERFMGKYFSDWLIEEQLLSDNCSKNEVFVYSNMKERTIKTAKAFVEGAFGDCVKVYHENTSVPDPVFHAVVKNTSKVFKDLAIKGIEKELENVDLKKEFAELQRILDFKNSSYCAILKECELEKVGNDIFVELHEEPDVRGPLKMANQIIDSFLMAYYDGMKNEDVAWGEITTMEQWKSLMTIVKTYHSLRFKTAPLATDTVKLLLEYMIDLFLTGQKKFYLLVGHDSNINSVISALNFERYDLRDQIEDTPIGGKVVFQKWYNEVSGQYFLRVNYVYQSLQQIRDGTVSSLENPPQWVLLKLKQCALDENGFCLWEDFIKILENVLNK